MHQPRGSTNKTRNNCENNSHQKTWRSKMKFQQLVSDTHVKRPHLHVMNILSRYPLFALNAGGKHAWSFLALVVSVLSLRVCREPAPSTTLGSGSNYRLNHFITNSTFFHIHQRNCRWQTKHYQGKCANNDCTSGDWWSHMRVYGCVSVLLNLCRYESLKMFKMIKQYKQYKTI